MNIIEQAYYEATRDWKLAHPQINAAAIRESQRMGDQTSLTCLAPPEPRPPTFSEIPLGEEFYDDEGNCWEKRSERRAISWYQYEAPEVADFSPTDKVTRK